MALYDSIIHINELYAIFCVRISKETMLSKILLKYLFRTESEFSLLFGTELQKGSPIIYVSSLRVWEKESFKKKIKSILSIKYYPTEQILEKAGKETVMETIFGNKENYGEELYRINLWHNSKIWNFDELTDFDLKRVNALESMTILIRTRHRSMTSNYLYLDIAEKSKSICILLHPMVVKMPVTSIQYYLDLHCAFAFNEIRKSNYDNADDLISYIYELQYIQQKIALTLHEFLYLVDYNEKQKGSSLLIKAELSAIIGAETIFSYLKASIEKTMVVLGLIYGIKNLESKKTHKAKLEALDKGIPENAKKQFYYRFIMEFIKSENLDELNNFRTGILHKKGIADLQPHNYVGQDAQSLPLKKIFQILVEQQSKNTAVLICTYSLLTDELVKINPPEIDPSELPL